LSEEESVDFFNENHVCFVWCYSGLAVDRCLFALLILFFLLPFPAGPSAAFRAADTPCLGDGAFFVLLFLSSRSTAEFEK
jgi:hypothetical protein